MTICKVLGTALTIGVTNATKLSSYHYYASYVGTIHSCSLMEPTERYSSKPGAQNLSVTCMNERMEKPFLETSQVFHNAFCKMLIQTRNISGGSSTCHVLCYGARVAIPQKPDMQLPSGGLCCPLVPVPHLTSEDMAAQRGQGVSGRW